MCFGIDVFSTLKKLFTAAVVSAFVLLTPVAADTGKSVWGAAYDGSDPTLLYLPDAYAVYWRYGWTRQPGETSGIAIRGQMPDARYFSYNVYDDETKSTVGSFPDYALKADAGGANPFAGEAMDTRSSYTIYVVPEGSPLKGDNVLYFPDSVSKISVMLRHYLPAGGLTGNVPLPTISALDGKTGSLSKAAANAPIPKLSKQELTNYLLPVMEKYAAELKSDPHKFVAELRQQQGNTKLDVQQLVAKQVVSPAFQYFKRGQPAQSYRLQPGGTYPNNDNLYLVMPIVRDANDVLYVRFRAPAIPASPADYPKSNLRYFSLSQGDDISYNLATMFDADMKVDADGIAHFFIGDDTTNNHARAKALGANFMPWKVRDKMLLVYRHMLPKSDYRYGNQNVPLFDKARPREGQEGSAFIGEYAPTGLMLEERVYQKLAELPEL